MSVTTPETRSGNSPRPWTFHLKTFLAVLGPGLIVMLADTDVGSIITAAQSGAQWGYQLLLLQIILIPILYIAQELTVRLGIFTGKGHGELIRSKFGAGWAWISVGGLILAGIGALLTEFSGVASVASLFGISRFWGLAVMIAFLLIVVWTGTYRRVERIAIALGLFELVFFVIAIYAHPNPGAIGTQMINLPIHHVSFLILVSANIGAVIMPWMIFYQQSAVTDKGLRPEHYQHARWDTAIGAIVTQLIMAAVLIATAATIGTTNPHAPLNTVGQVSHVLTPFLGAFLGRVIYSLGILGAAAVAAIVVSLAVAWSVGEVTGYRHSLELEPRQAPWFYAVYTIVILAGGVIVALARNLVTLVIVVEVMNAFLLPLVLGFLIALAIFALPSEHRLRGWYRWVVVAVFVLTAGLGIYGGIAGL